MAHPILIVQLSLLFSVLLNYCMVPDEFGHGIIILLLKNADGDKTTSSNYWGITMSPVISKIFELFLKSGPCIFSL